MSQYLPFVLIALACPIGMGVMMWFMNQRMKASHAQHGQAAQRHQEEPDGESTKTDLRSASAPSERP